MNGFKWASESEAYRRGVSCVNSQPGCPYPPDSKESADFYRGQHDAREHAERIKQYELTEEFDD